LADICVLFRYMCLISGLVSFVDPAAFLSSHLIGWPCQ